MRSCAPRARKRSSTASGYNDVDGAEDASSTRSTSTPLRRGRLARAADELDAVLVHYSTDFVFSGAATTPYTEEDSPEPQSVYAQSKLVGEWMAADCRRHLCRCGLKACSVAPGARSSVDRIIAAVREGAEAPVFFDRVVSPSFIADVAGALEHMLSGAAPYGLYHCVNSRSRDVARGRARNCPAARPARHRLNPVSVDDVKLRAVAAAVCGPQQSRTRRRRLRHAVVAGRDGALSCSEPPRYERHCRGSPDRLRAIRSLRAELLAATRTSPSATPRAARWRRAGRFLRGHDRAIVGLERIDEDVLAQLPELRVISKYGVGLDGDRSRRVARHGVKFGVDRRRQPPIGVGVDAGVRDCVVPSRAGIERRATRRNVPEACRPAADRPHGRHHRLRIRRAGPGPLLGAVWLPRARARHSRLPGVLRGAAA